MTVAGSSRSLDWQNLKLVDLMHQSDGKKARVCIAGRISISVSTAARNRAETLEKSTPNRCPFLVPHVKLLS